MKAHSKIILFLILVVGTPRTSPGEVTFTGLNDSLERNARALMPLASAECGAARWRVDRLFRDSDRKLNEALEALGYYDVQVDKSIDWSDPECWKADFRITVGDPVVLRDVAVSINGAANGDPVFGRQLAERQLPTGEILNHAHYQSYKKALIASAQSRGYFDADFRRSEVVVDRSLKVADVRIEVDSGPRYLFGDTQFTANILKRELLQGYSDIRPGEPYDARQVSELYEALSGSGYFGSVLVRADPAPDGSNVVPVNVSLTPGMRRVYTAGLGFNTDLGLQGRLGYTDRRRNDKGHQFESRLLLSSVDSELTASYRWPRRNPRSDWYNIYGGFQHTETDTFESDKVRLGIRRSKNISKFWLQTYYLNTTYEDYRVADQRDTSRLLIPGINWESTRSSEIVRIRNGRRMSLDIRGSSDAIGSDTSFLQLRASGKWISRLGENGRLLTRVELGATVKDKLQELPPSVRFFAGGDTSVRGYGFETLGPVDADGNIIGGSHLATASIEFDRLITQKWSAAVFADTGSAFNDSSPEFSTGVGIGLRWYSPLGPIRLDVAFPLNDPNNSTRLHITLGPDL